MNKQVTTKGFVNQLIYWGKQLAIFAVIFFAISRWQQKDMLDQGETITEPQLSLLSVEGEATHIQFDNGKEDSLVYFFAPWCGVCHASIDNLEEIYRSAPEALNIFVVALDWRSIEEVDEFLSHHQLSMPVLLGTRKVQRDFQVSAFPSYYFISRDAEIQSRNMGYSTELGLNMRLNFSR